MKVLIRFLVASVLSVGIALLLSHMSELRQSVLTAGGNEAIYSPSHPQLFHTGNVVDVLSGIPLKMEISNVEWTPNLLSIDLHDNGNVQAEDIYRDLYEIVHTGLRGTTNINQILIRVLTGTSAASVRGQLLLAMDAKRDDLTKDAEGAAGNLEDISNAKPFLLSHFSFNYSPRWNALFNNGD